MVVCALKQPGARALSEALLARAVLEHWRLPFLPDIQRGTYGKPFFPSHPDYYFNLSHSGDLLVCALNSAPVGVDIQMVKPCRPRLLDRVCSAEERLWLRQRADASEAFTLLWCMKESRCKQSGRGLSPPISAISVPLPRRDETVLKTDGLFFSLASGPDWRLCLCAAAPWDGSIRWLDGLDL